MDLEKALLRKVGEAVDRFKMIRDGDRVAVALSGGKDSATLLEALLLLQKRAPIHFTVLRPWLDVKRPGLIYWNSRNGFVTEEDFCEPIEGIEFEIPGLERFEDKSSPKVYFEFAGLGYKLGIEVLDEWWKQICARGDVGELPKTEAETDPRTGRTRLVVATLPDSEFEDYHDFERDNKRRQERCELRDKQLSLNGWKRVERDPEDIFVGLKVEHKYFTITHTSI